VILSVMHSWGEAVMHGLFCVGITWILFRSESSRFFRGVGEESI